MDFVHRNAITLIGLAFVVGLCAGPAFWSWVSHIVGFDQL